MLKLNTMKNILIHVLNIAKNKIIISNYCFVIRNFM